MAIVRPSRRRVMTLLAALFAVVFYGLLSPQSPARADYEHPCIPANLNEPQPIGPFANLQLFVADNPNPGGQVGVCPRVYAVGAFIGVGVGAYVVTPPFGMKGVLVQPEACADVIGLSECDTEGTTGAATGGGHVWVCAEQFCEYK